MLLKPSWACSWDSHEHLCSWNVHEHAHEALTSTCAWSCHAHDHFIELCIPVPFWAELGPAQPQLVYNLLLIIITQTCNSPLETGKLFSKLPSFINHCYWISYITVWQVTARATPPAPCCPTCGCRWRWSPTLCSCRPVTQQHTVTLQGTQLTDGNTASI